MTAGPKLSPVFAVLTDQCVPGAFVETEVVLTRHLLAEDTLRFGKETGFVGHCLSSFFTANPILSSV